MIDKNFLMDFGADLRDAEIKDSKFDASGYGEVTLWLPALCMDAIFAYRDDDPQVTLVEIDGGEDIEELSDVDWDTVLDGDLRERLRREQMENAGGPYFDFFYREYVTEEEFAELY